MKALRDFLGDSRRSQRGSALSGVLIITAMLAIICGALMTELSTNFLLSRNQMARVTNQATVNSAIELALSQLGGTSLNQPCPGLQPVTVNGQTAVPSYVSCWPTVDVRSAQLVRVGGQSASFNVDAAIGANGDYVAGDSGGHVFDYHFGSRVPRWTLSLGGSVTAPPLVLPNGLAPGQFMVGIPMSGPSCGGAAYCLNVRRDFNTSTLPTAQCLVPLDEPVVTQPVGSASIGGLTYFAHGQTLEANNMLVSGVDCDPEASAAISGSQPVAAGPVAFRCTSSCGQVVDYLYAVVSDGSSSRLVEYGYRSSTESMQQVWTSGPLWPGVSGLAIQAATLPTSAVITFQGGVVALFRLNANGAQLTASRQLSAGIFGAPYWCGAQCGDVIGVGTQDGRLYLYDSSLNASGSYANGSAVNTTPGVDGAGNWYFGAADGYVHEVQPQAGQLVQVKQYGPASEVGSSVRVGGCGTDICVYFGSLDGNLYLVPLDAREAVLSACISSLPPDCSGVNPRVWASVEVGVAGRPQTVHVQGWSYYSP